MKLARYPGAALQYLLPFFLCHSVCNALNMQAKEFRESHELFNQKASDWTQVYTSRHLGPARNQQRKRSRGQSLPSKKRRCSLATISEDDGEQSVEANGPRKTRISESYSNESQTVSFMHPPTGCTAEFLQEKHQRNLALSNQGRQLETSSEFTLISTCEADADAMEIEEIEIPWKRRRLGFMQVKLAINWMHGKMNANRIMLL